MSKEELTEEYPVMSRSKENAIIFGVTFLVVILVGTAGYLVWQKIKPERMESKISIRNIAKEETSKKSEAENKEENKNEKKEEERKNDVKISEIDVKILNGGAAAGSASKVKELLITNGYAKVQATNAKTSDHRQVTIYHKEKFSNQAAEIKDILKNTYGTVEIKSGVNEKEIGGDIVVILGK